MNELRLQYHRDTGKQIDRFINEDDIADGIFTGGDDDEYACTCEVGLKLTNWYEVKKYIEWLENQICTVEEAIKHSKKFIDYPLFFSRKVVPNQIETHETH